MRSAVAILLSTALLIGCPRSEDRTAVHSDTTIPRAAPMFRLRDASGKMLRLDELAYPGPEKPNAKKRPVLLNFFERSCKPCIEELPELKKLHAQYHPRGLDVVMIVILQEDGARAKFDELVRAEPLPFTVVFDEAEVFTKKYLGDPVTVPATFLIDKDGQVQAETSGLKRDLIEALGGTARFDSLLGT